jgi:hypothetical protein
MEKYGMELLTQAVLASAVEENDGLFFKGINASKKPLRMEKFGNTFDNTLDYFCAVVGLDSNYISRKAGF